MVKYIPSKIEKKWQKQWEREKIYRAKDQSPKDKKYILVEFPYPSGEGLHMGHLRPYTAGDVSARYWRMKGREVLYPMGWDAFGLPAENFAIKRGIHPSITAAKNIANAKKQLISWGMSFDWSREINTTDPAYYKWTQWIFLQLFKAGLAYEATGLINWCPKDKTGLANEEVIDGCCERCGTKMEKKELRQWYLKITAYAEKLLQGLKNLDWPEPVKVQQANWIGKSEGTEIEFPVGTRDQKQETRIKIFTTRVDTIYGATYLVLAPEHEAVESVKRKVQNWEEVEEYIEKTKNKTEIQRTAADKEKTGVELRGVKAINPATGQEMPIWVADYVLSGYGTGAIMAVPAHDERDAAFAKKFNLSFSEAPLVDKEEIIKKVGGQKVTQYKLRDWVFSRQRYWGEPIPIIHCEQCGAVAVPEKCLPVKLPVVKKYEPTGTGESPLAAMEKWVKVKCPQCGGEGRRETNTMPQWAGSSWYYLRYIDSQNKKELADKKLMERWLPVDIYFGGMEHTTLHLLYSRFWHLFLHDQGVVPAEEPYTKRISHGIVLAEDGEKMSKSRGNVVSPDEIVKEWGADTLRMYELFLGPHEEAVSWNSRGIVGVKRFLDRIWNYFQRPETRDQRQEEEKELGLVWHRAVKKVGKDLESAHFNTAVSELMKLFHEMEREEAVSLKEKETFLKLLAPLAPHLAEEIWRGVLKYNQSIHLEPWPEYEEQYLEEKTANLMVQINGKTREVLVVRKDLSEEEAKIMALASEKIKKYLEGKEIKKFVYLSNRLINVVI